MFERVKSLKNSQLPYFSVSSGKSTAEKQNGRDNCKRNRMTAIVLQAGRDEKDRRGGRGSANAVLINRPADGRVHTEFFERPDFAPRGNSASGNNGKLCRRPQIAEPFE